MSAVSGKTGMQSDGKGFFFRFRSFALLMSMLCAWGLQTEARPPNIVILMADDLGIGDVGCFGNTTLRTPNIDRLGEEGVRLTHNLAMSSVCTPSRAAFLTGRYPIRSGMSTHHMLSVLPFVACSGGLPDKELTFAEIVKQAGYNTAFIGKWHLGFSCSSQTDFCHHPLKHGFDYFYGLPLTNLKDFGDDNDSVVTAKLPFIYPLLFNSIPIGIFLNLFFYKQGILSHKCTFMLTLIFILIPAFLIVFTKNIKLINSILMRNYDIVEQPIRVETLTRRFAQEGVAFLEHRSNDQPFLLFVSWTHVHSILMTAKSFSGQSQHGIYGDAVEELDWGVGQILDSLDHLGFHNNTFVYFTSDNGAHLEERDAQGRVAGGYNGIYKGGKTHGAVDGGIRVPTLIRWPGVISAHSSLHEPTCLMDFLPTISQIVGTSLPSNHQIDGRSILPLLQRPLSLGPIISPHEFLFHYCGTKIFAIRHRPRTGSDVFKLILWTAEYIDNTSDCQYVCTCNRAIQLSQPRLYEMTSDPGENIPLDTTSAKNMKMIDHMLLAMNKHINAQEAVESQFSVSNLIWKPWLQPCCNFPYCACQDEKYADMDG